MLGSSFDQTMMGCSPKCYIPSFVKIWLPVHEKKIFEWFLAGLHEVHRAIVVTSVVPVYVYVYVRPCYTFG